MTVEELECQLLALCSKAEELARSKLAELSASAGKGGLVDAKQRDYAQVRQLSVGLTEVSEQWVAARVGRALTPRRKEEA